MKSEEHLKARDDQCEQSTEDLEVHIAFFVLRLTPNVAAQGRKIQMPPPIASVHFIPSSGQ